MNSYVCKECEGCRHITNKVDEWCYMFRDAPEQLPCGQHDKYAELRRINGKLFAKNPLLFMISRGLLK